MQLYTVGYEGLDIDEFVLFLKKKRIQLIADVRKNPVSRKKGFSKNRLAEALKSQKIDYLHLPGLGTPSAWRKLADKNLMTRKQMFEEFVEKILPAHPDDLATLRNKMREKRMALLCYEADPADCHRSYVAQEIQRLEGGVVDIVNLSFSVPTVRPLRDALDAR